MASQIKQVSLENIDWTDIFDDYSLSGGSDDSDIEYVDVGGSSSSSSAGTSGSYEDAATLLGDIGNWTIGDDYLKIGEGSEQVGLSGEVTAADDVRIWAGSSDKTLAAFRVYESGALVATSATITGTITATSGFIGGFEIGSTYIRDVADSFGMASYVSGGDDIRFWSGDTYANRASAPFRITESGVIYAESGTIGGWTLGSTTLTSTSSNVVLDGANEQVTVGSNIILDGPSTQITVGSAITIDGATQSIEVGANIVLDGPADQITIGAGLILDGATERIHVGSGSPNILIDGSAKTVGTDTFVSGAQGWRVDYDGSAEFNNIVARGEFRTAVFVQDEIHATGGTVLINTASTLEADATTVTTPTTSTIDITDPPSGHAQIFAVNDILRIKDGSGLDNWLKVTAVSDQTTFYRYTVDKQSGTNGTFYAGTSVVKYGISTDGGILLTSDMSNAPYIDIFLNGATPWAGIDTKARLGWLYGITDTDVGLSATDVWGLYSDSVYLSGVIVANTGKIGGTTNYWDISAGSLAAVGSGDVEIRAGQTDYNTGTGFWMGLDSGTAKFSLGDSTGDYLTWDGSLLNINGTIAVGSLPNLPSDSDLYGYWAFDEEQGATALDATTNGNDGTITNGTYEPGVSGTCLEFDGASGSVKVDDESSLQNVWDGGGFLSFWISPDSDGEGSTARVFDKDLGSNGWGLTTASEAGGFLKLNFFQRFSSSYGQWEMTDLEIAIGEWNHVVIYYDCDSISNDPVIYVNGESIGVTELVAPSGTRDDDTGLDLYIGNRSADDKTYDGLIDEVRFYDGEPSVANVQALYSVPAGNVAAYVTSLVNLPLDSSLEGYWAFDEGSGVAALDSTQNANDGVISGAIYAAGPSGTCLYFDGTNDLVTTALDIDPTAIPVISISCWVKPTRFSHGSRQQVWSGDDGGYDRCLAIETNNNFGVLTGSGVWEPAAATLNEWQHVVVIYTATDILCYINGTAYSRGTAPTAGGSVNTLAFGGSPVPMEYFQGYIDEARVYNYQVTQSEVNALMLNPGGNTVTVIGPDQISTTNLSAISATLGTITVGTGGYVRQGQTDFDTGEGFWIGDDSGTPKLSIGDSDGAKLTWDGSKLKVGGDILNTGDGSDGALNVTSGTTTINCAGADVVQKEYTSINIASGATLAFSNPGTNGTMIVLKSVGNVTITGTIDATGMGADGGNGGNAGDTDPGDDGSEGISTVFYLKEGRGGYAGGSGASPQATVVTPAYDVENKFTIHQIGSINFYAGTGGGGGGQGGIDGVYHDNHGGAGGSGGGGLMIVCGGTYTATGSIDVSGDNGSNGQTGTSQVQGGGGGGGGAAGSIYVIYSDAGTDTATYTADGGDGGDGGDGQSGIWGPDCGGGGGSGGNNRYQGGDGGTGLNASSADGEDGDDSDYGGNGGGGGTRGVTDTFDNAEGGGGGGGGAGGDVIVIPSSQLI